MNKESCQTNLKRAHELDRTQCNTDILAAYLGDGRAQPATDVFCQFLARHIRDITWTVRIDATGSRLTYVSPSIIGLTGFTAAEAVALPIEQSLAPTSWQAAREAFAELMAQAKSGGELPPAARDEFEMICKDGSTVWVEAQATLLVDAAHGVVEVMGISRNITERKRIEEALRKSEEKFRTIVENTHELIMLTRPDGIIDYLSPSCPDVLGYDPSDLVGRQPWIICPTDTAAVEQAFQNALTGKTQSNFEYRIRTKAGSVKWVSHSWRPILQGEQLLMVVSVVHDITERKRAQDKARVYQQRLRRLASQLSLVEEEQRRRMATALHDHLGQTLAVTKMKLGRVRTGLAHGELTREIDDVRTLLDEAIGYTRTLTFELSPPILYELGFEAAVQWLLEGVRKRHNLETAFEDDGQVKPLGEDIRVVLFQGVRELLANVVKHARATHVRVSVSRNGQRIRVQVADNGMGFDLAAVTAKAAQDCSFGLFHIRERLDSLGGGFGICSSPGAGTIVTLEAALKRAAITISAEPDTHRAKLGSP